MRIPRLSIVLLSCYTIFIVYCTMMPCLLVTSHAELLYKISTISWNPLYNTAEHEVTSKADVFANVFFFIPFGFFGLYAIIRKNRKPARSIVIVTIAGLLLSILVETLQLFTIDRSTDTSDVITNTCGAFAGAWCASRISTEYIRRFFNQHLAPFVRTRTAYPLLVIAGITTIASLTPFDFEFSRQSILAKIPAFMFHFHNSPAVAIAEDAIPVIFFTLLSCMFLACFREWKLRHYCSLGLGAALTTGVLLELGMFCVGTRTPNLHNSAGIILGCFVGLLLFRFCRENYSKTKAWALTLSGVMSLILLALAGPIEHIPKLFMFKTPIEYASYQALAQLAYTTQLLMLFVPAGFVITLLSHKKRKATVLLLIVLVPVSTTIMALILFGSLHIDYLRSMLITTEAGVLLGAFLGTTGWKLFRYYVHTSIRE